ncbi:MAG: hypothetical protein WC708_10115 [Lentisphaeria bacterium]
MKIPHPLPLVAVALMSAMILASCCSKPKGEHRHQTTIQPGVPGKVTVDTYTQTATVTGIDKAARKLTLVDPDGAKTTFTAGPEVANFAQIEVGDQVKATMAEQLVVFVRKPGETSGNSAATVVAVAPLGEKPGVVMADTEEITAKVKSIDVKHQKATLLFPDGTSKTYKVRKDADLTKQTVGSEVVIRTTTAVAISVEKP